MCPAKLIAPRLLRELVTRRSIVVINLDVPVGQQCAACSAAGEAHLFLDSEPQILNEMKAIRHLRCLRRTFTSSLRVKPASISAYHLNRRVLLQPSCNAYHAPVLENVQDLSAFKIDNDRAVAPRFPPTPVIDTDDTCRGVVVDPCSIALQVPKDGVVTDRHPKPPHQALSGPPACTVTEQADYFGDPRCPAGVRGGNRWGPVSERLSSARPICAAPAAQLEPHRHGTALDRQVLKIAVRPAVSTSALMSAIWAYARLWPASRHNPITLFAGYDALHFNARTGRPFRFRSHASP
ncbi:hypothetical protein ACVJBD_000336 [Rhizobium mongolense]